MYTLKVRQVLEFILLFIFPSQLMLSLSARQQAPQITVSHFVPQRSAGHSTASAIASAT
jgi:hypothetical protein